MPLLTLLADRNSAANVWLRENPLVITAGALVLGSVLVYFGIAGLKSGETKGKYGNQLSGGTASMVSVLRLVMGIGVIGVGIYVAIFGAW